MAKAVVLTGGIGSGKTTVEKIFVSLGIETIDADKISHSLLNKNTETYEKVVDVFGRFILTDQDEIDRSKMREIIFRNPTAKKRLEKYLHPRIQSVMDEKVKVILVNIFAGINRCDWVAEGIVQALEKIEVKVPLVIRLAGTNVEKGNKILKDSKINFIEANTLEDAANKAVAALGK